MFKRLKWFLWRRVRQTWCVGVSAVIFNEEVHETYVLLVKKRLGVSLGWQLPGGGKSRWLSLADAAQKEVYEESGVIAYGFREVGYILNDEVLDIIFILIGKAVKPVDIMVRDWLEISEAKFVPLSQTENMLSSDTQKNIFRKALQAYSGVYQ